MTAEPAIPPLEALLAHREWVRRYARTLVRDESAADDLSQEAWLTAVENPPRHASAPTGWLRRVLHTRAINRARGERRRETRQHAVAQPEVAPAADEVVALAESHRLVVEAVLALEEPYRTTVLLRFFDDLSPREIAARMTTSVDNVYSRLRRAAERLRERLDAEHGRERRRAAFLLLAGTPAGPAAKPASVGVGAAAAGGAIMATSNKVMAGAALLLLVGVWATWRALDDEGGAKRRPVETAGGAVRDAGGGVGRRHAKEEGVEPAPVPPAPPAAETDSVLFEGSVVDVEGRPVSDAAVVAMPTRPSAELGTPPDSGRSMLTSDGEFQFQLPKGTTTADLMATGKGFIVGVVERARPGRPIEIRLAREGVLVGRVLDPTGKAIAGATVRAFRVVGRETIDRDEATTGKDGTFRLGSWAGSTGADATMKRPFLDIRAPGFGGTQDHGEFPEAGQEVRRDVVLFPSRPMKVLVTDADSGAPVDGAWVSVGLASTPLQVRPSRDSDYVLPHPAPYLAEGTSDARGVCVLKDAPARLPMLEQLVVRAWRKGFTAEFSIVKNRPQTDDEQVEVRLWPSATVKGRVVDTAGKPVVASVTSFPNDGSGGQWFPAPTGDLPWCGWVKTDADGSYVLPCVPATAGGTRAVAVWTWANDGHSGVDLRPRSGETVTAPDIVVAVAKPLRGAAFTIVDSDGAPIFDAIVASPGARDGPVRTDDAGRAVLHWPAGNVMGYVLEAEPAVDVYARGFARTALKCRPEVATTPETRVALEPGLRLEGRVVEQDGRPVAHAQVTAQRADVFAYWPIDATTGDDGRFVIDDLPARAFDVSVSTKPFWAPDRQDARVAEAKGAVPGGMPIEIQVPPETTKRGTLVAVVIDEEGGPVVEAAVHVESEPRTQSATSSTSTPGVMTLSVPVGTWTVKANARGRIQASASATIVEGQTTNVSLVVARGTPVSVRVALPAGFRGSPDGLYAARVDVAPGLAGAGADHFTHEWTADHASAKFDSLPAGRYVLHYETPAWGRAPETYVALAPIDIGPPGRTTARAQAELVAGGFIAVKIEDPEAVDSPKSGPESAPGAVEVLAPGGERRRVLRGAVRGPVRTIGLVAGDYIVRLHLPSGRVRETTATVRVGETTETVFGPK